MNIYLDIETCPDQRPGALQAYIDNVRPPATYKKPESIQAWMDDNAASVAEEQWSRTALDPMQGEIIVACWAVEQGGEVKSVMRGLQESERDFLASFLDQQSEAMLDEYSQHRIPRYVGWNVQEFDLRYLAIRCAIHGLIPSLPFPIAERFNGTRVLDLMKVWSGYKDYRSQRAVAEALGIPVISDIEGKNIWVLVRDQGPGPALEKCQSDIDLLRKIHARMGPCFGC